MVASATWAFEPNAYRSADHDPVLAGLALARSVATSDGDVDGPSLSAWPNPAGDRMSVSLVVPGVADVRLVVYDALGREVARLIDRPLAAGAHEVALDVSALAPGVYVLRLARFGPALQSRVPEARTDPKRWVGTAQSTISPSPGSRSSHPKRRQRS